MDYDALYRGTDDYFGDAPVPLLERFVGRVRPGGQVLDVGVGQGRNALFLARKGFRVTGIDPSAEAIKVVAERARAESLVVELRRVACSNLEPTSGPFDAILVFGLLQDIPRDEWSDLLDRLHLWTAPGGVLFLTAWHIGDPRYAEIARTWRAIGKNSFREASAGRVRSFLSTGEIAELLVGWKLLHHWEGLGPEHRHGDGAVERHGVVEVVAERELRGWLPVGGRGMSKSTPCSTVTSSSVPSGKPSTTPTSTPPLR